VKHIAARFKHQTGFLQVALRLQPTPKDLTGGIDNPAEGIGIFSRQIVQKGLPNIHHKIQIYVYIYWLVVLTTLKNMKVNGKDCPIYYGK
jgi:hypothetical protein